MTIESTLASIASSLDRIATALESKPVQAVSAPVAAPVQAPITPVTTPVATVATPVAAPQQTPAPTPTAPIAPFNLAHFVVESYKALGPVKGAGIQQILQSVGAKNINDVKPEHYETVKNAVNALMGS